MTEPRWIAAARKEIGQREIPGAKHNGRILKYWSLMRAPFTDDETPWCAGFVGAMLEGVAIKSSRSAAARSYLKWGRKITKPVVGCIVVFERGPRHGHVGFLVGLDTRGNLMILGGNQGDAVNIKPFQRSRVLGYRWPAGEPLPGEGAIAEIETEEAVSRAEDEGGPTKAPAPKPKPRPAPLPELEDIDEDETPPEPAKTGITEGNLATGGLTIAGIATFVWEKLSEAPQSLLDAVMKAAEKPSFWFGVAALGTVGYVGYRRFCQKCRK